MRKTRTVATSICLAIIVSLLFPAARMNSQEKLPDYKNPRLPVERRVADLVSRLTLEEKVAQLVCLWVDRPQVKPQTDFATDRGDFSAAKATEVMKHGIGQIARHREQKDPREGANFANAVQKWLVEISLSPGETKTIEFVITRDKLSFLDLNMKSVVEPGWFDIMVGTSSLKYETVKLQVIAK